MPDGRCGILIADVSGHGTPAAVLMAITHSIAHAHPGHPEPPGPLLAHINRHLTERYTTDGETFVTAFYGVYDPAGRTFRYACAGHNPPRLMRCATGEITSLDGANGLPLGIDGDQSYEEQDAGPPARRPDPLLHRWHHRGRGPRRQPLRPRPPGPVLTRCTLEASDLIHAVLDSRRGVHRRPARRRRPDVIGREDFMTSIPEIVAYGHDPGGTGGLPTSVFGHAQTLVGKPPAPPSRK